VPVAVLSGLPDGLYGEELERRIEAACGTIRDRLAADPSLAGEPPRLALILGSGLGGAADLLDDEPRLRIPYREIPHVPGAGVTGHAGELLIGRAQGRTVAILSGRAHGYEGYAARETTLLLRAVIGLGTDTVVLTNAAGGLNPDFEAGDLMLMRDLINLSGENPLRGPNLDRLGPRFPALTDAFDAALLEQARRAAARAGIRVREGVYVMLAGPSYETRAELAMLRLLGGDAVGMSTVPEVIVARHAGLRVLGISLITNKATVDMSGEVTHEEVMEVARVGAGRLLSVLAELVPSIV
jgi:purine-nucleoside phosphorylase